MYGYQVGDGVNNWIEKISSLYCKALEMILVVLLASMVILVFGNVLLRYGFNSGITVSEELSRWAFVWMTFLGAIIAVKDGQHIGTDMLVGRLGVFGKRVCFGLAEVLMIYCCWLIFSGGLSQTQLNMSVEAPVSGWSMAWLSGAGVVFAVSAGLFHCFKLTRLLQGRLDDHELIAVQESDDFAQIKVSAGDQK